MNIRSSMIWNILSVMVLAATAVVLVIYGIIFFQPSVGFNVFAPGSLPDQIVLVTDTPTPTLMAFRSITPTTYNSPTLTPTISRTPTITLSPTITSTQPTSTTTRTPTITGTLPTITLTPTISRTATNTTNPAILTDIARTRIAGTKTAAVQLTNQAGTEAKLRQTRDAERTQNAALTQTAQAGNLTATAAQLTATHFVGTQTQAVILTNTQAAVQTATQAVIQTSTSTAITQVAEMTRTEQAQIELDLPIAYSVGDGTNADWFITQRLSNPGGPTEYELNMTGSHPGALAASGWWMTEANNHYLLFSDPDDFNPVFRVLYTTQVTIEQIVTGIGNFITDVVVDRQSGVETDRQMAFSFAAGGFGTDRNIHKIVWDPAMNGGLGGWNNVQLTSNLAVDEHSPHWINSGTTYNGYLMYVAGPASDPENIVIKAANPSAGITSVTFYDEFANTEISEPKWCTGYDWENESVFHRIVYGMRTSAGDDWDLYMADPFELIADGNNDSIIRLTNTPGINEWAPDWSPFCNRIAFLSDEGGNRNVWTYSVSPAGVKSDKVALTNNGLIQMSPLWMPYKP